MSEAGEKALKYANILTQEGISAAYYNAGLEHPVRNEVQQNWTIGKIRVIVATNAFGMGIDKADVRFVIHADLPDSPEAYFQEAGRAGRDGKKSFAILLSSASDTLDRKSTDSGQFSGYCTPLKAPILPWAITCKYRSEEEKECHLILIINDFARTYRLSPFTSFSSLKILELEGYIELTEEINNPSRIKFMLDRDDLYRFQVSNSRFDAFIKLLLRSYTGVFTEYTSH